jgi:hypothetical protein
VVRFITDSEWNNTAVVHINEDISEANGVTFHPKASQTTVFATCANAHCTLRDGQILYNSTSSPQHTF